jgi:hypothetical protein
MDRAELLIRYGFIKEEAKDDYNYNEEKGIFEPAEGKKLNKGDANQEVREILANVFGKTDYPVSKKYYELAWEVYDLSIEEPYFWVLDTVQGTFPTVEKLEDSFAASEQSAFFGTTQQRLGAQQDKVSQFLATVGKMIKELFQMVRELRIIDERLGYYDSVDETLKKPIGERDKTSEVTLKGFFVDLVQGGGKSAASVFGMAQQLEFVSLPDLFFDSPPFKDRDEINNHINSLGEDFNKTLQIALTRHLNHYFEWRNRTYQEHKQRKHFQKAYLKQHFEIVQMYLQWLKPYLRNVSRMGLKEKNMLSPNLVSAFEGSMLDIEFLARTNPKPIKVGDKTVTKGYDCLLVTFNYRTRPELKVVQDGYQRGPVHIGKMEFRLRSYRWTDEDIKNYKKLKEEETLILMGNISASISLAMDTLGDELNKYIHDSEDDEDEKAKEKPKPSLIEKLFGDFYNSKSKKSGSTKSGFDRKALAEIEKFKKDKPGTANGVAWVTYNNFKKAHRMITW